MIHQKSKIALFFAGGIIVASFAFSLYVLLTTENTIIVVNEAAAEPKEMFVAENSPPTPETEAPAAKQQIQILDTGVGFLNVRSDASLQAAKVGTVKPGEVYEYTESKNNWYRIVHPEFESAWVSGLYVKEVGREG